MDNHVKQALQRTTVVSEAFPSLCWLSCFPDLQSSEYVVTSAWHALRRAALLAPDYPILVTGQAAQGLTLLATGWSCMYCTSSLCWGRS